MEDEAKTSLGAKHVDNKVPQNITIPKIDKSFFFYYKPNRREYGDILDTLSNGRLNMALELKDSWIFPEIKLVINRRLNERFFAKRSEMKKLGRHNRELEDKFSFLVVPRETATDIAQHGLCVGSTTTKELGNPEMGVYLFRHIDVALNVARQKKMSSFVVLIFKVLFGKTKTVQPCSALKSIMDPTPNFDSHISEKVPAWNDPFDEQVINSLIYVYEYDGNTKPVKSPRQCLPIAEVEATFRMKTAIRATVLERLPTKFIEPGNPKLTSCTVVKRNGKGKDATYQSACPPQTTGIQTNQSNVSDKDCTKESSENPEKSKDYRCTAKKQEKGYIKKLYYKYKDDNVIELLPYTLGEEKLEPSKKLGTNDIVYTVNASEKEDLVLQTSNKINSETSSREGSLHADHSSIISSTEAGMLRTDVDESVQGADIDEAIQALHSKEMINQALVFPKHTIENVSDDDLCFMAELENRIDWNGIFGMELEKVNATLETLQCSSVRRVRDPSGMRCFPDMEITIANNHYMRAGCYNNNIAGQIKPSIEIKEAISKTFADINDVPQDRHITDSIPEKEVNAKQVENSSNKTDYSSPNKKAAEIPKPPTADRK